MASSSVPREPSHAAEGNYAPIAIVGIGCHLPEGIHSPSQLWDFLAQGRCAVSEMPTSRFNINGYHGAQEEPGTAKARGGCFIQEDIHKFENQFFGINNREAAAIDPQQRKLLEVVFESFESAGVPLEDVQRANLGCYVASFKPDFIAMQTKDPQTLNRYSQTGLGTSILANRISHVFNLKGPSCVVDTACLSSMYALHMACTALQRGECDAAVVAGVNLIQSPELHVSISQGGVLSQSSMCRTFDAAADGYVRAEGVIAIYIKRLDEAVHNRDSIRSIIRATAVNSNGHTPGIALPSADGQEAVIRKAYAIGGLDPMETPYVETHGTGTSVGDPIEVEALSRVFYRPSQPTLIGSVKPSLGHGEASSGLLSIIKAILAFEHGLIPATIGITQINPNIKAAEWGVQVVTAMTRFPAHDSSSIRHRISINSFGYGGANAHGILEEGECEVNGVCPTQSTTTSMPYLLPFSAIKPSSLQRRVQDLSTLDLSTLSIKDLAYTLCQRRSHFPSRGYIVSGQEGLATSLTTSNLRTSSPGSRRLGDGKLLFSFTGQGAQWKGMARELLHFAVFADTLRKLDDALKKTRTFNYCVRPRS